MAPAIPYIIMAVGAAYAGYTQHQAASYNAKIATQEADYRMKKGQADEEAHLDRLKKAMAEGKVATAKSGVSLMSGSAQDVFDENLEEGLYDAVMIRYGAAAESRSLLAKAAGLRSEGKAALIGGAIGASAKGAQGYQAYKDADKPPAGNTGATTLKTQ